MDNNELSICITTYNRAKQIENTLKCLENQTCLNFKIYIINNASDYLIENLFVSLNQEFVKRISCINRIRNIGMRANISSIFDYCDTKWCWQISDDDDIQYDAVERIYSSIKDNPDAAIIDFTITNFPTKEQEFVIDVFNEFLKLYYPHIRGEIIWISDKVYNTQLINKELCKTYDFAYSGIYAGLLFIKVIEAHKKILMIQNPIVSYTVGSAFWNMKSISLGLRTLPDFFDYLPSSQLRKVLRILSFDFITVTSSFYMNEKSNRTTLYFDELINGLYKYMWSFSKRFFGQIMIVLSRFYFGNIILRMTFMKIVPFFQKVLVELYKIKVKLLKRG